MQMRGDGLTNRQIAERLDISYGTVKRYIGNQPKGLRAEYGSYAARVKGVEEVTDPKRMAEAYEPRTELTLCQSLFLHMVPAGNKSRPRGEGFREGVT